MGISQTSRQAKSLFALAKANSLAKKDSLGAIHFYQSAKEELKLSAPDWACGNKYLDDLTK